MIVESSNFKLIFSYCLVKFLTLHFSFKFRISGTYSSPSSAGMAVILIKDSFKNGKEKFVFIISENVTVIFP